MAATAYTFFFVEPWPWWLGGMIIGLLVPGMYFFLHTALGVSSGYGSFIKLILPKTRLRWLNTDSFSDLLSWRIFFIGGMVIGAFISARLAEDPAFSLEMGRFTSLVQWSFPSFALWFLGGGMLLGLGSRIAGGCTSGHSIHGLASLQLSGFLATATFLTFGALTVYLMRVYLLGGI